MTEIELNPNCSEAVMRIRTDNLNECERGRLTNLLQELEKDEERWYHTGFSDETIFGVSCITIQGDVPYNNLDWLTNNLQTLCFYDKLDIEGEDSY